MPLVTLTARLGDFCRGVHTQATLTVCLNQPCILREPQPAAVPPLPGEVLDPTVKSVPLVNGTASIELDSTNDLLPVAPNTVRPMYKVSLTAPGWGGCTYVGPITANVSLYTLLRLGGGVPSPLPVFDLGILNFGIVDPNLVLELTDGTVFNVPVADFQRGHAGVWVGSADYDPAADRLEFVGASSADDIRRGDIIFWIAPANIDYQSNALEFHIPDANNDTYSLRDRDYGEVNALHLSRNRIYEAARLVHPVDGDYIRILTAHEDRRRDFSIIACWTLDQIVDSAEALAGNSSDTSVVTMPAYIGDPNTEAYIAIGLPAITPDLYDIRDSLGDEWIDNFDKQAGTVDVNGVDYEFWIIALPQRVSFYDGETWTVTQLGISR